MNLHETNLDKLINKNVVVSTSGQQGIYGVLYDTDKFGIVIVTEVESNDEVKEKGVVYIPHSSVLFISARENDNHRLMDSFTNA